MSDFYAQLEEQLYSAGLRRSGRGPLRRAAAAQRPLLVALAVVVVLAAGAAVVPVLLDRSSPRMDPPARAEETTSLERNLSGVRVTVLNATTQAGLGRRVAAILKSRGARITAVADALDQTMKHSEIRFRAGADPQARRVAAALGIARISMHNPEAESRPGEVVVFVGADRFRLPAPGEHPRVYTSAQAAVLVAGRVSGLRDVICTPTRGSIAWDCSARMGGRAWNCTAGIRSLRPRADLIVRCSPGPLQR